MTKEYSAEHDHGPVTEPGNRRMPLTHLALAKVLLVDGKQHTNRMEALFNPQELAISARVQAGRLHPVGWSHPIKQYAYTEEVGFSLNFLFTKLALRWSGEQAGRQVPAPTEKQAVADATAPAAWLTSFCYGAYPGLAPHPLIVVWPHVLTMVTTVDTVQERYKRFAPDLSAMEVMVSVKFSELRKTFKSSGMQWDGWKRHADLPTEESGWGTSVELSYGMAISRTFMGGAGK